MGKSAKMSKPAAVATPKKSGDGGRISKPAAKVEKSKTAAKAVVAAASKKNGIVKESKVSIVSIMTDLIESVQEGRIG